VAAGPAALLLPVEWAQAERDRAGSRAVLLTFGKSPGEGRVLVILPAGRLSHLRRHGLVERPRRGAAIGLARRFGAPIVPMWIDARNSVPFQLPSRPGRELRDVTPFRELVDEHDRRFGLRLAAPLERCALEGDRWR
jgi:putative hemolysin